LVDVNEVIGEMIVLLRGETTRYSISVRTELAADLPQVRGDRVQLLQVMMNLIMNSIDAMKDVDDTRELVIKSQNSENEHLLVSVGDTGVGLPPQQADQIFNAFFTTKPNGTGMGLRISRSIIESHGGRLWAANKPPRGASFCFTLPVAKKLGFKVLRFSIGFGKPLLMRVGRDADRTEYCVAAIPLGGYVKLLDEREGEVLPSELHRSFTRRPVWHRIAVLLAGPAMNLIFASVLYAVLAMAGSQVVKPVVGQVRLDSPAAAADCSAATRSCGSAIGTSTMSRTCRLR